MSIRNFHQILVFGTFSFLFPVFLNAQQIIKKVNPDEAIIYEANQILSAVEHYEVDFPALSRKLNTREEIEITIPINGKIKTLTFEKTNILTPDYRLHTSSGKTFNTAKNYSFYFGEVQGQSNSKACMVFQDDEMAISIYDQDGNFEINKINNLYAGYYAHDRIEPFDKDWACQVIEDAEVAKEQDHKTRSSTNPECVTVFLEIDHNMYNKKGSNIANTEAWAMNLFVQVAILFIEYNVPVNISGIQVWDTPDPYISATNTSSALSLFRSAVQNNPNFNGRLAHLLSGRSLGGGIAYLNSLCSNSTNKAVSANLNGGNTPYPNYSWNVMVITHEMGHNMGSNHTQACVWNGNNTAIDGCGAIEGSCSDPGNPPNNIGGTIMSYCHLTSSGINLNNGFGPQPGTLIEGKYTNASCVTGTGCSFVPPFNDICNRSKELPVLNYCIDGYFTNYGTTASGDGGSMTCGDSGVENDIWYQFEHIDVTEVQLSVQATDDISDIVVEIYKGTCSNLTSVDCGFSENGGAVTISFNDPTLINETLYIRIVEKGSDEEGEFSICIFSDELPCQNQLDTMLNIYEDLAGVNWIDKSGWEDGFTNGECDYCNWYGVTCNYLGQIIGIDLSNNNLQGMLPEDLIELTYLQSLRLNNNALFDTIPNYWDSLDRLYLLDLSSNSLTGEIPLSYASMAKINTIHLDDNSLDTDIPPGLGYNASLRTFTASNNLLTGCFSAGISSFCYKDSINLDNNIGLPYSGDVTLLCENGWGTDWDLDGFCNDIEDCNDFDEDINPNAEEILCDAIDNNCNGSFDEGSDFGPNIWVGPDTLGIFDDPMNWSLGHIPTICENVEIGLSGDIINLVLLGNNTGGGTQGGEGGSSNSLQIRDLIIGNNTTLYLPDTNSMAILGNGVILNNGAMNIEGYINIRDQNNTSNTAFHNNGSFSIIGYGGISISQIGDIGIYNTSTGTMEFDGYSNVESYNSEVAKSAIINEGVINILNSLYIYGTFTDETIKNSSGAIMEVKAEANLSVNQ